MSSPTTTPDGPARAPVTAVFLANGLALASFLVRIPDVRDGLGLRDATVGVVLATLAIGVLLGLVLAGRLVGILGSRILTLAGAAVVVVALPLAGFATSRWWLILALTVLGAGSSAMDVGMNAQGVGVERGAGRSIMVGLHGAWSVGSVVAAFAGSMAMATEVSVGLHLSIIAGVVLAVTAAASPGLRVADRRAPGTATGLALPRGVLFPLALVALAASLGESTATDWSGIHLADNLEVAAGRVGWGFVAFTTAMTVIRLVGDLVVRRVGRARTIVTGGVSGAIGFVTVAAAPFLPAGGGLGVALVGFVLIGLGMGITTPLAFAAAGAAGDPPGSGVAAVATVGYLAFIGGPLAVGLTAEVAGLPTAFVGVAIVILLLTARRQPALTG